jgi:hypothetical protein
MSAWKVIGTAVEKQVLGRDEAGLHAAQEGAGVAEFVRRPEAAGGVGGAAAREHLGGVQALVLRPLPGGLAQAVGLEGAGQQVVDGDVVAHVLPRDAGDEAGQAGARAVGQAQDVDRRLHGRRGDVDDAAEAPRGHAVERGADHLDGREHVGVERGEPGVAVPVTEMPGLGAAGVVHQDVEPRVGGERGRAALGRRDVGRHRMHLNAGRAADVIGRCFERLAAARHQRQAHAFGGQRFGAGPAQAAARCADERVSPLESQLHAAAPRRRGARERPSGQTAPASAATRAMKGLEEGMAGSGRTGGSAAIIPTAPARVACHFDCHD